MDPGRAKQWEIWRSWTPRQRLAAVGRMTATVLAIHAQGLSRRSGITDPERLRELRVASVRRRYQT